MAKLTPMLGAVFAHATSPGESRGRPKPKTGSLRKTGHKVTKGEGSVTQPRQQHGELATAMAPAPLSERQQMKDHARHEKRRATESWISGHMSTAEHSAVHKRADHILSGKHPKQFSGKSGERSFGRLK